MIRYGVPSDFDVIYKLATHNNDLLGPINPMEIRQGLENRHSQLIPRSSLIVAEQDGIFLGFTLYNVLKRKPQITIAQICVVEEGRGKHVGSAMVDWIKNTYGRDIRTSCVKDSSADLFWSKVATKYDESPGKKRPVCRYIIKVKGGGLF